MHIAILGATSQIARDFVAAADLTGMYTFSLYARRPDAVKQWVESLSLNHILQVQGFDQFGSGPSYDGVINFVGVGDPAVAQSIGPSILDITLEFDGLVLNYLNKYPETRYLFLSSGAAYGSEFFDPVSDQSHAKFSINELKSQDWYGIAKFHAESRHRALGALPIIDIRVFSYFSRTQDISARFLMSDILRAIRDKTPFMTTDHNIVRDYLHPLDFHALVKLLLKAPAGNAVVDCYSLAPIDKISLLDAMQESFGLTYKYVTESGLGKASVIKSNYYSLNRQAAKFGYQPKLTALEGVLKEAEFILRQHGPRSS